MKKRFDMEDLDCANCAAKLERHLNILETVGFIAPLLGLLGTVLGMMRTFQTIHATQSVYLNATELSGSINMALITTAAGLTVAIPCYVAYNYLLSRVNTIALDMEKAESTILNFFRTHPPVNNVSRSKAVVNAREDAPVSTSGDTRA